MTVVGATGEFALAIILYNLFLWVSLRDRAHLYYVFFAFMNIWILLLSFNFPGVPHLFGVKWFSIASLIRPMAALSMIMFTTTLLQTKIRHPKWRRALLVYSTLLPALMVARLFVSEPVLNDIETPYMLLCLFLSMSVGICSWYKGFPPAKYYVLGIGQHQEKWDNG